MLACTNAIRSGSAQSLFSPVTTLRAYKTHTTSLSSLSRSRNSPHAHHVYERRLSRSQMRRSFASSAAQAPSPSATNMLATPPGSEPSEPTALQPVPQLPKYPAKWLSKEEVQAYLYPLYQRGWYLSMEPLPDGQPRESHTLKKTFVFRKRIWSAAFAKEVADTMIRLNHDGMLLLNVYKVTLETQTHSAFIPHPENTDQRVLCPGITLYDIHLANEIENLWTESCENNRVAKEHMQVVRNVGDPLALNERNRAQVESLVEHAKASGFVDLNGPM